MIVGASAPVTTISSRLLYPKAADGGLYSLADPDTVLSRLAEFVAAAAQLAAAGNLLPGPGAADTYNDFAFALPGGAKESYFELKFSLIAARLADLAPLWRASAPLPVSTSTCSPIRSKPSASANRATAARCASRPRPLLPWRAVETRR